MTWRRSAVSWGFGSTWLQAAVWRGRHAASSRDGREHYPPMPEQDANVLEVLIGQMAERCEIDAVFSKALRVLGHAELFEPVRNLLHCAAPLRRVVTPLQTDI